MKVIPEYKVIGLYNYDKIIHNTEKKIMLYRSDKWKDAFDFKNKKMCNSLKQTFPNTLKVKHLAGYLYCSW